MKPGVEWNTSAPLSWDPEPKEHTMSARGTYYVTALRERESRFGDIRTFGDQVGRQIKTRKEAFAILDGLNERGYVQQWSDSSQQRYVIAERDEAGDWTAVNPFTGTREALNVAA